jgi:Ca2+-binding RTX toxin-like protein
MALIYGTSGNEVLDGTIGDDQIYGFGGNDTIKGGNGNDTIYSETGNDSLYGGDGDDIFSDSGGNNFFDAGNGDDKVYGDSGNDTIIGGNGNDYLSGHDGADSIDGGDGNDILFSYGRVGNKNLVGGKGDDEISGGFGNDTLDGGDGIDTLKGYEGNDTYYVRDVYDSIYDTEGNDTAYVSVNFAKIPSSIENVIYTDGALALPYWIDALLEDTASGSNFQLLLGGTKTWYYVFPSSLPSYDTNLDNAKGWTAFTETQITRTKQALELVTNIFDFKFIESKNPSALNTLTFANNSQNDSAAYAKNPSKYLFGSDIFIDKSDGIKNFSDGTYGAYVLIHEIGHALGLKHPFAGTDNDPPYLSTAENKTLWTLMSYETSFNQYSFNFSPFDIAALQYIYGPSSKARTSNDKYVISQDASNFIWDGAGTDTLDASALTQGATLYMTPGYWSFVGNARASTITSAGQVTVNFGTVLENLIGSAFADILYGNETNNIINGGAGNDQITGGGGNDTIDGGDGNDTLVVNGLSTNYIVVYDTALQSYSIEAKSGTDGKDSIKNVELIKFSDKTQALQNTDVTPPTISISSALKTLNSSQITVITFTLSESTTNFVATDILVNGGTLSNFIGSGSTYTVTFTPTSNATTANVSVPSGAFTDAAGNTNADGSDANNTLTFSITTENKYETHTLSVIVDKGILGQGAVLLNGLTEKMTMTNGVITTHTVEYAGSTFDYKQIDALITTVVRDGEFSEEFKKELTDAMPSTSSLLYKDAVLLVGITNIDNQLIYVAGIDGSYVS